MRHSVHIALVLLIVLGGVCLAEREENEREDSDRHERRERHDRRQPASRELSAPTTRPVSYSKDIKPMLQKDCYSCHSAADQQGGYRVDSRNAFLKNGEIAKAGDSANSKVIRMIGKGEMPPRGERITPEQLSLFRAWIDQGVKWDE